MGLSIRNLAAERLAREVASITGENLTQAVLRSLEERLERLKGRRQPSILVEDILAISRRCSVLPDLDTRSPEEILGYDEHGGLPSW